MNYLFFCTFETKFRAQIAQETGRECKFAATDRKT